MLIELAAVLEIQHFQVEPLDGAAAFHQSLATGRCCLAGFGMGAQQMLNRLRIPGRQGESAKARAHQLLGRGRQLLPGNQGPAAAVVGTPATGALRRLTRRGSPAEAQGYGRCWGHGLGYVAALCYAADSGLEP